MDEIWSSWCQSGWMPTRSEDGLFGGIPPASPVWYRAVLECYGFSSLSPGSPRVFWFGSSCLVLLQSKCTESSGIRYAQARWEWLGDSLTVSCSRLDLQHRFVLPAVLWCKASGMSLGSLGFGGLWHALSCLPGGCPMHVACAVGDFTAGPICVREESV